MGMGTCCGELFANWTVIAAETLGLLPLLQNTPKQWSKSNSTMTHGIKRETFYRRTTSMGTGILILAYGRTNLWIRFRLGHRSTGVGKAKGARGYVYGQDKHRTSYDERVWSSVARYACIPSIQNTSKIYRKLFYLSMHMLKTVIDRIFSSVRTLICFLLCQFVAKWRRIQRREKSTLPLSKKLVYYTRSHATLFTRSMCICSTSNACARMNTFSLSMDTQ